ncbi:MAG: hypothetical protein ACKPKO_15825, partial [Candidatus Fonsibacter sp.]
PIGPEWPSCYYNAKLSLMLSVYVDDFKMSGPTSNILAGWKALRGGLHIEPEQRIDDKGAVYLQLPAYCFITQIGFWTRCYNNDLRYGRCS